MLRQIFFLFLLVFPFVLSAQGISTGFESNAVSKDSTDLRKFLKATAHYDLAVALVKDNYWSASTIYYIMAKKKGHWHQLYLVTDIHDRMGNVDTAKVKISHRHARQKQCDSVWQQLKKHHFLTMSAEAQKINSKKIYNEKKQDTITTYKTINHGRYYEFIIKSKDNLRIIGSCEPQAYYKWNPEIVDRKYFVDCLNVYGKLWK